jgi:hypothetical protein
MHIFTNERESRAAGITKRHLVGQCPRPIGLFESNNSSFILRGIASRDRKLTTIGGFAFARFAVRVDIHLEWDKRDSIVVEGRIHSHGTRASPHPRPMPTAPSSTSLSTTYRYPLDLAARQSSRTRRDCRTTKPKDKSGGPEAIIIPRHGLIGGKQSPILIIPWFIFSPFLDDSTVGSSERCI